MTTQKVALITGSGSGISRATARAFCREGYAVMLNGRRPEKLEQTRLSLLLEGYNVEACAADVTDPNACAVLREATLAAFGRLDVLVTNAGSSSQTRWEDSTFEVLRMAVDSHIYGTLAPIKAFLDVLKQHKGSIIMISSISGMYGFPGSGAYSTGKMALTALSQSLRHELEPEGVHVGLLKVGYVQNDPDKRTIAADGSLAPLGQRHPLFVKTQEQVAQEIIAMVRRRRREKTLSALGFLLKFMLFFTPGLVRFMIDRGYRSRKALFK